jgi:hypothetical protein
MQTVKFVRWQEGDAWMLSNPTEESSESVKTKDEPS